MSGATQTTSSTPQRLKNWSLTLGGTEPRPRPVLLGAEEVEVVETYRYLGLWLDNKLDWMSNNKQLYKKFQSRMYFLRRRRSFNRSIRSVRGHQRSLLRRGVLGGEHTKFRQGVPEKLHLKNGQTD